MNVLMLYPKFPASTFWNPDAARRAVTGRRGSMPPLGLLTVAAHLPPDFTARIIDRNVEEETAEDWEWADAVFLSLMLVQEPDYRRCAAIARARGKPYAVGGPYTHARPEEAARADWFCEGEGEPVLDALVADMRAGRRGRRYVGGSATDMERVKPPRFDLLRNPRVYGTMPVQYSRGCPFRCEFCDVIEIHGRVPRTKRPAQILAELDALRRAGFDGDVFIVDDNFIGNKARALALARELKVWGDARGRPYGFHTEASMDLADEPELLEAMAAAGFDFVFLGIETPDPRLLRGALKFQNIVEKPLEKLARIRAHGLHIAAGFIVGFDDEGPGVFAAQREFIAASGIAIAMTATLYAVPHTPLWRRLGGEGRLLPPLDAEGAARREAVPVLNFTPRGTLSRRDYLAGYAALIEEIYSAGPYFDRARRAALALRRGAADTAAARRLEAVLPRLARRFERLLADAEARRCFEEGLSQVRRLNAPATGLYLMDSLFFLHLREHGRRLAADCRAYAALPPRGEDLDEVRRPSDGDVVDEPGASQVGGGEEPAAAGARRRL